MVYYDNLKNNQKIEHFCFNLNLYVLKLFYICLKYIQIDHDLFFLPFYRQIKII